MAYLDIISLDEAKIYLRIDDTLTEDDNQLTRMINGALSYVEKKTNYILFEREKDYRFVDGSVRVYDYPINSVSTPTEADMDIEYKTLHANFCYGTSSDELTLNVGYSDVTDIPQELIEVAYEIIELMYYEKETNKNHLTDLSTLSKEILNSYKRFII